MCEDSANAVCCKAKFEVEFGTFAVLPRSSHRGIQWHRWFFLPLPSHHLYLSISCHHEKIFVHIRAHLCLLIRTLITISTTIKQENVTRTLTTSMFAYLHINHHYVCLFDVRKCVLIYTHQTPHQPPSQLSPASTRLQRWAAAQGVLQLVQLCASLIAWSMGLIVISTIGKP